MDKPHIRLKEVFYDCGWRYEIWTCSIGCWVVTGSSPSDAYKRFAGAIA